MFIEVAMLILTGLLWTLIGIAVSRCAVCGQNYNMVQGATAFLTALISIIVLLVFSMWPSTQRGAMIVAGLCILGGIANYANYFLTGHAMKYGHNGLIWALMQTSMVSSFIMGAIFFGDNITLFRIIGALFLLAGVFLMGSAKSSGVVCKDAPRYKWLVPTLGALVLASVTQCSGTLISYFPELRESSPVFRSAATNIGVFFAFALAVPFDSALKRKPTRKEIQYSLILLFSGLIAGYVLFYNALDRLQQYNLTAIGYPVSLGACIAAFMLYSTLILREKTSIAGWGGFLACLAGITFLAIP